MNRLAILAATGVLALMLVGCGEDTTKPDTDVKVHVEDSDKAVVTPAPTAAPTPDQTNENKSN